MANVKISELPVATSLSNGDSFPVVQGGVTKQAARSVLFASPTFTGTTTADLLTAAGDVTFDGGAFVFNESGADKDARFEGDTDANLLFLDASTDRIGIGTAAPAAKLHLLVPSAVNVELRIGNNQSYASVIENAVGEMQLFTPGSAMTFSTNSAEAVRIDSSGNVGIGTTTPGARLDVNGNTSVAGNVTLTGDVVLANDQYLYWGVGDGSAYVRGNSTSDYVSFGTVGVERMRLDSSGNLIYRVNGTAPTLSTNSTMSFELTSNTSLRIVVRGTDGTTRSVSLTLA